MGIDRALNMWKRHLFAALDILKALPIFLIHSAPDDEPAQEGGINIFN